MCILTHASIVIASSLNSLERLRRDEFYGLNNFQQRLGSHRREKNETLRYGMFKSVATARAKYIKFTWQS